MEYCGLGLIMVFKSLNAFYFRSCYPVSIKFTLECMLYQDFSSQIYSLQTMHFPIAFCTLCNKKM